MSRLSYRQRLVVVVLMAVLAFGVGAFAREDEELIAPCPPACCPPSCKSIEFGSWEWWLGSVCGGWPKKCSLHPGEEESLFSRAASAIVATVKDPASMVRGRRQ